MKLYGSDCSENNQKQSLLQGEVSVAVYGLGKMGLPLAAVYADVTGDVTGVDIDDEVVETVRNGNSHIKREPGLEGLVSNSVEEGKLTATTVGESAASDASLHVVIVPTLIDDENNPNFDNIESVISNIGSGLTPGDVVVIESTVPPRTCSDVIEPQLAKESGLNKDDFGLAFCPERTASGRAIEDIRGSYPKVVGGTDEEATRVARLIYEEINDTGVIPVTDATTAESVKVFEGVYRDVNIALANELAKLTDELQIDVTEAIEVANTLPMCDIHTPGVGVGGHCIPYYPYFLINQFDGNTFILETARKINDSMPIFTAEKVLSGLDRCNIKYSRATVVVLGVTYRSGVAETRHTPARPLVDHLQKAGVTVLTVDPLLEIGRFNGAEHISIESLYNRVIDGIVLVTDHNEFAGIEWNQITPEPPIVVDGRQAGIGEWDNSYKYTIGSNT